MFGLHWLDVAVIFAYFGLLILIGLLTAARIKNEEDFFMGGRSLGRTLQMFMNFGMATSTEHIVGAARETFRQGLAGVWINLFVLFMTPFYWFTTVWLRRLRMTSMADIFKLRYESRVMEKFYAIFGMLVFMGMIGLSLVALQKTVEIIAIKPPEKLTIEEKQYIQNFEQLTALKQQMETRSLTPEEKEAYERLVALQVQGKVRSSISNISPQLFMPIIGLIILAYALAGGLLAAAITDFFQGTLMIILSFLLLPVGLIKIGGFTGLHQRVSESFFNIFGSAAMSEYPWYYVLSIVVMGLVLVEASPHNCQIMGSAKDEESARVGRVLGNFLKRYTVVIWGFTGVLGYGLYRHAISDPDMVWGYMTRQLLGPGLIGLMLVGLIAALMSTASAFIISAGALITQNFYKPLFPSRSEKEYVLVGRLGGGLMLVGAMLIALFFNDILRILRFTWSLGLIFGPAYWMAIIWRRSSTKGAWASIIFTTIFTVLISYFIANVKPIARIRFLCQTTQTKLIIAKTGANAEDVKKGLAQREGQVITKQIEIPPSGIFFEDAVKEHPNDPNSKLIGKNRFRTTLLIPALLGIDLTRFAKGDLIALGYYLDVIIPFLLIIFISKFSRMNSTSILNEFYARLHTPVRGSRAEDERELQLTLARPDRFKNHKLFPNSNIELLRPTWRDLWGFMAAWLAVGSVILLLVVLAKLGG